MHEKPSNRNLWILIIEWDTLFNLEKAPFLFQLSVEEAHQK